MQHRFCSPKYIFRDTDVPCILHPHIDFNYVVYAEPNAATCTFNDDKIDAIIDLAVNANFDVYEFLDTIHSHANSVSNTHRIIVLSSTCIISVDRPSLKYPYCSLFKWNSDNLSLIAIGTFNLPFYPKANTVMDTRGLSGKE
ncbi:hypothetical protein J1N35_008309 [Gossypium stocksii]|uniref:Uncharacterized protein n=1 Tax=Gossypium stocksii TaxID=47602 RepID=A0A9D4AGK0_9ROSI|nr:hypothetical protein J1N35_008309 [Gossypium stocksii]